MMDTFEELKFFFENIIADNQTETLRCIEDLRKVTQEVIDENRQLFLQNLAGLTALLPTEESEYASDLSQVEIIKELVGGNDIRKLNQELLKLKSNIEKTGSQETALLNDTILSLINQSETTYQRLQEKTDDICRNLVSLLENQHEKHIYRIDTQDILNETAGKFFLK